MIFIEWIYRKVVSPLKEIKSVDEIKKITKIKMKFHIYTLVILKEN